MPVLFTSTNPGTASWATTITGITLDGDVNIPEGSVLSFDTTDVTFSANAGNEVLVEGPGFLVFSDNFGLYFGTLYDVLLYADGATGNLWASGGDFGAGALLIGDEFGTEATLSSESDGKVGTRSYWYTDDKTAATAVLSSTTEIRLQTGDATVNAAAAGGYSGDIVLRTGITDVTNAGGSGGNSGKIDFITGAANSTAGVAGGDSGAINFYTGNSVDGDSGDITFNPGTAPNGSVGTVQSFARLTTTDGVSGGTARIVGGVANISGTASAAVDNNHSLFTTGAYVIPQATVNVGTKIKFDALIGVTATSGAGATLQVRVYFGGIAGTLIFDTASLAIGGTAGNGLNGLLHVEGTLVGRTDCRTGAGTVTGRMRCAFGHVDAAIDFDRLDVAGSVAGTYTVALNNSGGGGVSFGISGVTDAAGTTAVMQYFNVDMVG